ncbi:chemotaxis protein CheC [Bittarella sp. HCP28S3_D9]|uniref:chemotaxis protein CheC n=1 Tax=Bittarella sp. HCP28S3_D9 TaxID=3440253 RepID=UPI003F8CB267
MRRYSDMSEDTRDVLAEVGNIGTGNAVSALAGMIGQQIDMELPTIRLLPYQEVPALLGGAEDFQVGVLLETTGDINGMFMFLLSEPFTRQLLGALVGEAPESAAELDEMGTSAICEVGNIMCCSYINALARMMDVKVHVSVPSVCSDMVGALLSVPMIRFANLSDEMLFIENQYHLGELSVVSHILFLPEVDSIEKILTALDLPYET